MPSVMFTFLDVMGVCDICKLCYNDNDNLYSKEVM